MIFRPLGSTGIDDSDGLVCAISSLTPDDLQGLSTSLNATDDRGIDDAWSGGYGFLSNLY